MFLRSVSFACLLFGSLTMLALAGSQEPEHAAFEVVAIRQVKPQAPPSEVVFVATDVVRMVGDRLHATNSSALGLIHAAYRSEYADRDQIIGADGWIASERFDVEARADRVLTETPVSPPLPARAAIMLQQVLRERFQLRVRRETRELPRLVLTHARADRSLKPGIRVSDCDCTAVPVPLRADAQCEYRPLPGELSMRGMPIDSLIDYLSRPAYAGGRVVDGTGITELIDVDLEWSLDFKDLFTSRANLMTALQEQLGLKLESRRLPLPVLIIEHIERPSAN